MDNMQLVLSYHENDGELTDRLINAACSLLRTMTMLQQIDIVIQTEGIGGYIYSWFLAT